MFRKNLEINCSYCRFGHVLTNKADCICQKYGIISIGMRCRKFKYEPLKRIPHTPPTLSLYKKSDFDIS